MLEGGTHITLSKWIMGVCQNHSLDFTLAFAVESFKVLLVALEGLHGEWVDVSK